MGKMLRRMSRHPENYTVRIDPHGFAKLACRYAREGDAKELNALLSLCKDIPAFNPDAFGPSAQSPAMIAARYGHADCLQVLANHGARFDKQGRGSISALDLARRALAFLNGDCLWLERCDCHDRDRLELSMSIMEQSLLDANCPPSESFARSATRI